jgi:phosphoribosylamine--glycine ligase
MKDKLKVLVIGSGGREHCLVDKLSRSALVDKIYIAPGNGGTACLGQNVDIKADDLDSLTAFAQENKIDLTIVGPEAPLVLGIVDKFEAQGLKIFGPRQGLARLEGSKVFAKEMMAKYAVPTADFKVFEDAKEAKDFIDKKDTSLVVKADGLAAGKGVFVCNDKAEAYAAIDAIMVDKKFGRAGEKIVIEDRLEGEEASILVFTDGKTILPLVSSQDHKRVFDDDKGPNTGGMGAYAPAPVVSEEMLSLIMDKVFKPLIFGLKDDGLVFKGILYGGLMIKDAEAKVLEFNVRFGDPETQAILPKLNTDLTEIILATVEERLEGLDLEWDKRFCICVVLASGGYPGSYQKGKPIKGLEKIKGLKDVFVFQAGTKKGEAFVTSGGRVLGVTGLGDDIQEARSKVYQAIKEISFDGMHYRRDIANKALKHNLRSKI